MRFCKTALIAGVTVMAMGSLVLAEIRFQDRKEAVVVVTGQITEVKSEKKAFGNDGEQTHFTLKLTVADVEKGDGIKKGDVLTVTCYTTTKYPTRPMPAPYGHRMDGQKEYTPYVPKMNDQVKVYLNAKENDVYGMLYPFGHEAVEKPK